MSLLVDDQYKALKFSMETLGFVVVHGTVGNLIQNLGMKE